MPESSCCGQNRSGQFALLAALLIAVAAGWAVAQKQKPAGEENVAEKAHRHGDRKRLDRICAAAELDRSKLLRLLIHDAEQRLLPRAKRRAERREERPSR